MGHYASEMDPNWGKPSFSETKLAEVQDDRIRNLAEALFKGFDSGVHLEATNVAISIQVAGAIDELIKVRVEEVLGIAKSTQEA